MSNSDVRAWHFLEVPPPGEPPRLPYGDNRPVVVGKSVRVSPPLLPCRHGLHASPDILGALAYGKGMQCCRVLLRGKVVPVFHNDRTVEKYCASERRVLTMVDISVVVEEWIQWAVATTLDGDWPEPPRTVWAWFHHDGDGIAAYESAIYRYHNTRNNQRLEAAALLVSQVSHPDRHLRFRAASVALMLLNNELYTVKADMARTRLLERVAPALGVSLEELA